MTERRVIVDVTRHRHASKQPCDAEHHRDIQPLVGEAFMAVCNEHIRCPLLLCCAWLSGVAIKMNVCMAWAMSTHAHLALIVFFCVPVHTRTGIEASSILLHDDAGDDVLVGLVE